MTFTLEPHPILPPHTKAEAAEFVERFRKLPTERQAALAEQLSLRAQRIAMAEADPLRAGFDLDCWKIADEQLALAECEILCLFGWNRGGGKTRWALKRLCEAAMAYEDGEYLVLGENINTSATIQHRPVWEYLEKYIGQFNSKQAATHHKVNYSDVGGFTMGVVQIPQTRALIHFDVYGSDPNKWEGKEFGARIKQWKYRPDGTRIENVAVVCDESLSLLYFKMLARRVRYRGGKLIWPFTPIHGITPAVKEVVGTLKVVKSERAELFDLLKLSPPNVPGCPRGHMPVVGIPVWPRSRAVYFHWSRQSFNNYSEIVKQDCEGKTPEYVERIGHGYSRDSITRALPQFGPWNIIDEKDLPEVGTNYRFCDPHDARAWFITKVRVTPGDEPDFYIYDEWPDYDTYGDWATPTERETSEDTTKGWDGDVGPAQFAQVDGIVGYKKIFREMDTIRHDSEPERDPQRRKRQLEAKKLGRPVFEQIADEYIDSRAGPRPHLEEHGQTCTVWEFEKEHTDPETGEVLEPVYFQMVSGEKIDLNLVRELMACRKNAEGLIVKPPRLFIVRKCRQHIWAAENYTGRSGEKGASKDPIDNKRYIAGADLVHRSETRPRVWRPGVDEDED
jgi:hypothetical protein